MAKGCEIVSGFLMKHACDYPATGKCASCGKRVCAGHSRPLEPGEEAGAGANIPSPGDEAVMCTECVKQHIGQRAPAAGDDARAERDPYRDRYYHDPFFWGMYHHPHYRPYSVHDDYDSHDYDAFEQGEAGGAGFESDFEGT